MNYSCEPCDKIFNGSKPYTDHLNSEKHKSKVSSNATSVSSNIIREENPIMDECIITQGEGYKCVPCSITLNGVQQAESHAKGKNHLKNVKLYQNYLSSRIKTSDSEALPDKIASLQPQEQHADVVMTPVPNVPGHNFGKYIIQIGDVYKCILCDVTMPDSQLTRNHISGTNHLKRITSENQPLLHFPQPDLSNIKIPDSWVDDTRKKSSQSSIGSIESNLPISSLIKTAPYKLDKYITQTEQSYKCVICDKKLNCALQAQNHVDGAKHSKQIKIHLFDTQMLKSPDSSTSSVESTLFHNLSNDKIDFSASNNVSNSNTSNIRSAHLNSQVASKLRNNKLDKYITKTNYGYKCVACNLRLNSIQQTESHVMGKSHSKQIKGVSISVSNAIESEVWLIDDDSPLSCLENIDTENVTSDIKVFDIDEPITI